MTLKSTAAALLMLSGLGSGAALAEGALQAPDVPFSFEGPFGTFDKGQLQRGYKVYKEVCAACHSMKYVAFRNLGQPGALGYSAAQIKALAGTFTIHDGPNEQGETFERPGLPSDFFPAPFPNDQAAAYANGGSLPPDLSLITKAREGWHGTITQLVYGIGGPEYVYGVLTGYHKAPEEAGVAPAGKYYNPYFANGHWIAMPPPLQDGQVTFDDGAPNTADAMARDVSAFLAWAGDPNMQVRKSTGFSTMIFLIVLAGLMYFVKQRVWSKVAH